jgi:hypothetical protein
VDPQSVGVALIVVALVATVLSLRSLRSGSRPAFVAAGALLLGVAVLVVVLVGASWSSGYWGGIGD